MDPKDPKASPFPGLTIAGEHDDLVDLPNEITMTEDWIGWLNQLLLSNINENSPGRLSHVLFVPDTEAGEVIIMRCNHNNYGATEVKYTETENGATVNLRLALKRFKLQKQPGRIRVFPVTERKAPDGQICVAFSVKNSETRPARKRKKKEGASATATAKPAESKPAEAKPVEAKPVEAKPVEAMQAEPQKTSPVADTAATTQQTKNSD